MAGAVCGDRPCGCRSSRNVNQGVDKNSRPTIVRNNGIRALRVICRDNLARIIESPIFTTDRRRCQCKD